MYHRHLTAVFASLTLSLTTGCFLSPRDANLEDGARFFAEEVDDISASSSGLMGSGFAKTTAAQTDTQTADWIIHPYTYDSTAKAFIRRAIFSISTGYERTRIDTVIFKDAAGNTLSRPTPLSVATIDHVRRITHAKGGNQADIRVVTHAVFTNEGSTRVGVWNGTMSGTYNDEPMATGTITNVTRRNSVGRWDFPESGTVNADFPNWNYEITYLGGQTATAYVTNKHRDKVTEINISVQ